MAAGDRHQEKIPFQKGFKPTHSSSGGDGDMASDINLPKAEIEELIDEHYKGAAHGVERSTVARQGGTSTGSPDRSRFPRHAVDSL
jgi:hypothetical protein